MQEIHVMDIGIYTLVYIRDSLDKAIASFYLPSGNYFCVESFPGFQNVENRLDCCKMWEQHCNQDHCAVGYAYGISGMLAIVGVSSLHEVRHWRTNGDIIPSDGRIINRELVKAVLALSYRQYSKDEILGELDEEAKNLKRGLWSDKNPPAPWEFRENPKKTVTEPENSGMSVELEQEYVPAVQTEEKPFVGNSSSSIFHISSWSCAGKIASANRIPVGTTDEAVKAGREPCKLCSPTGYAVAPVETEGGGRCQATTKKGTQCKRNAEAGSKYCWQHAR